jgi:hypothetical protein
MKKSDIFTAFKTPGIYIRDQDKSEPKTYWFPFKRKLKLNKIINKLNGK